MSWDIYIYINNIKNASKADCERYMAQFGIIAQVHPESDFETHFAFLPFKLEFPSHELLKGKIFISGFEIYTDVYNYKQELRGIKELPQEKSGGIMSLFKKKTIPPADNTETYIINQQADNLLKECNHFVNLRVNSGDSFEPIVALAFASYLAENCSGIIYDTFSGKYFYDNPKREMTDRIQEFFGGLAPKNLQYHVFEGWL